jgi:hypothetical protein
MYFKVKVFSIAKGQRNVFAYILTVIMSIVLAGADTVFFLLEFALLIGGNDPEYGISF